MKDTSTRTKKVIPAMLPTKKWLTSSEACSYLNMSLNKFTTIAKDHKLKTSAIGSTRYYMVSQLDAMLDNNIIINN